MKHLRQYYFFVLLFCLPMLMLQTTGCYKDYSIESIDTARVLRDSPPPAPLPVVSKEFPVCSFCNPSSAISVGHWSFNTGNSFLCGGVTNSGYIGGYSKTDFTFFGPSACSIDTGLVISVYLALPLDKDQFNLTTFQTAFYYYDHHATKDIFISMPSKPFSVTVQSFFVATGIATGTFGGTVYKANGDTTDITNGKFTVSLK
ncbi:MAG: hypothetical protein ABIY62_10290 [Ginsengibacter sp.]